MTYQTIRLGDVLKARSERFKPNDPSIAAYQRIDKIDFSGKIHLSEKSSNTDMILIRKGDLVISGINVAKGACAVYEGDMPVCATIHYSSYVYDIQQIDIEYLKIFLKSPDFVDLLKEQVPGGIKTEIKPKHILGLKVRLPDLSYQHYVVTNYAQQEAILAKLKGEFFSQENLLNNLQQSILQDAIQGKLTENFRLTKSSNPYVANEIGADLLARIQAEKAELVKNKKLKKEKPLPPITDAEKPFELPEGWIWCRLGEVANIFGGLTLGKKYNEELVEVPYLRVANVQRSYVDLTHVKTIWVPASEALKYQIGLNDLLVNEGGDFDKVGRAAKWKEEISECIHQNHLFRVQSLAKTYDWLLNVINSDDSRKYFLRGYVKTTNLASISSTTLKNLPVPLPPLAEQQAIIEAVEQAMGKLGQLREELSHQRTHAGELLKALLHRAFQVEEANEVDVATPIEA